MSSPILSSRQQPNNKSKIQSAAQQQALAQLTLRQRSKEKQFLKDYEEDRVAFIHDCFEWEEDKGPTFYQDEIAQTLDDPKIDRVAVRGPHGLGKTAFSAWNIHHFAITRNIKKSDWKVLTTASVWRQLQKYLWPEIHKWARNLKWNKIPARPYDPKWELQDLQLKLRYGSAFALASNDHTALEGAHADELYYNFDEAKVIPDATWEAAEGAFSNAGADTDNYAKALAISTPGDPIGKFYRIHKRSPGTEDWVAKHVNLEMAIKANRISRHWAAQRAKEWGKLSAKYLNRVEGEFSETRAEGVIPLHWLTSAYERYDALENEWEKEGISKQAAIKKYWSFTAISADPGDSGSDPAIVGRLHVPKKRSEEANDRADKDVSADVFFARYGQPNDDQIGNLSGNDEAEGEHISAARRFLVSEIEEFDKGNDDKAIILLANQLSRIMKSNPNLVALIDALGPGAGTAQRLREIIDNPVNNIKGEVVSYKGSEGTDVLDFAGENGFKVVRSAAYWHLRELLDPSNGFELILERNDELTQELLTPTYKELDNATIKVLPKDQVKKILGKSTNYADTLAMLLWVRLVETDLFWMFG